MIPDSSNTASAAPCHFATFHRKPLSRWPLRSTRGATAESIVITDNLQIPDVLFEDAAYGAGQNVDIDGAFCNADANPADGCTYDAGTGALSIAIPDITNGGSSTITYQVQVNTL